MCFKCKNSEFVVDWHVKSNDDWEEQKRHFGLGGQGGSWWKLTKASHRILFFKLPILLFRYRKSGSLMSNRKQNCGCLCVKMTKNEGSLKNGIFCKGMVKMWPNAVFVIMNSQIFVFLFFTVLLLHIAIQLFINCSLLKCIS